MIQRDALIVFFRTPQIDRSNPEDTFSALPWEDIDFLFSAMTSDLIRTVSQLTTFDLLVYRNQAEVSDDFFFPYHQRLKLLDLEPASPAEQIRQGTEHAYTLGYQSVVVLLQNHPFISKKIITDVFNQLGYEDDCFVVGPTVDNRCFLVGMKMNHSAVFDIGGGNDPLKQELLMKNICQTDSMIFLLPPIIPLDHAGYLMNLMKHMESVDKMAPEYPSKTATAFKTLQKKYKLMKNGV
jgi:glycosyltransferase A (GT-A) superfamily protein (DUF2064 family)